MDSSRAMPMLVRLVVLGIITAIPMQASAIEPERPGQQSLLTRAVFAERRLWVLSDAGDLSSIAEGQDTRSAETLPEKALDLCVRDGRPVIVTGAKDGSEWTLRQHSDGVWSTSVVIQTDADGLLAMHCSASGITLLTTRRLIDLDRLRRD